MLFSVILKLLPSSKGVHHTYLDPKLLQGCLCSYPDPGTQLASWQSPAPPYSGSVLPCTAPVGHDLEHLLLKTTTEAVRTSGFTQNEAPLPHAESKHGLGGQHKMLAAFCARLCC